MYKYASRIQYVWIWKRYQTWLTTVSSKERLLAISAFDTGKINNNNWFYRQIRKTHLSLIAENNVLVGFVVTQAVIDQNKNFLFSS